MKAGCWVVAAGAGFAAGMGAGFVGAVSIDPAGWLERERRGGLRYPVNWRRRFPIARTLRMRLRG